MSAMLKEIEKIYEESRRADEQYKRDRIERLKDSAYRQSLSGELRLKCMSAMRHLLEAAEHPLSSRQEMREAMLDVQHAQAVADALDPEEE